jgi:hypothetical protein
VCCCGTLLLKCYIYEFNYLYVLTSILIRIGCIKRLDVSWMTRLLSKLASLIKMLDVSGMTWLFVGDDVDS